MTISLIQHKNKNDFMSMNISFPPTHRFAKDLTINFIEFDDLVCIFHSILGRPQTNTINLFYILSGEDLREIIYNRAPVFRCVSTSRFHKFCVCVCLCVCLSPVLISLCRRLFSPLTPLYSPV